jgi:transcriptional regulator with XRE-family HTH domain
MSSTESKEAKAREVADIEAAVRHRIQFLRKRQGVTQADMAEGLGIVAQQYHKYESGVLRLSSGMLAQIARILDCSILDLVPQELRSSNGLDRDARLDALKQELSGLILEENSQEVLIAVLTLLRAKRSAA